jgi:hypothetical protein
LRQRAAFGEESTDGGDEVDGSPRHGCEASGWSAILAR